MDENSVKQLRKDIKMFVQNIPTEAGKITISGNVKSKTKRNALVTSLEAEFAALRSTPKGLRSGSPASAHAEAWKEARTAAKISTKHQYVYKDFLDRLATCSSMDHSTIWKNVHSLLAPYIYFHCAKDSHCYLARAVLAHHLLLQWYDVLRTQFSGCYP
jgi:hypothetical protein